MAHFQSVRVLSVLGWQSSSAARWYAAHSQFRSEAGSKFIFECIPIQVQVLDQRHNMTKRNSCTKHSISRYYNAPRIPSAGASLGCRVAELFETSPPLGRNARTCLFTNGKATSLMRLGDSCYRISDTERTENFLRKRIFQWEGSFSREFCSSDLLVNSDATANTPGGDDGLEIIASSAAASSSVLIIPKLESPTTDLVNKTCAVLEREVWGPNIEAKLEAMNFNLTSYTLHHIITRLKTQPDVALEFFHWARRKAEQKLTLPVYIATLSVVGNYNGVKTLVKMLDIIHEDGYQNAWSFNTAFKCCGEANDADGALEIWAQMARLEVKPTVITYTRLIDLLAKAGRHEAAVEVYKHMLKAGCPPNISTYSVLMNAYTIAGHPDAASALFDKLSELRCKPNFQTYKTLILAFAKTNNGALAAKYFEKMKAAGLEPDDEVSTVVGSLAPAADGSDLKASPEAAAGSSPSTPSASVTTRPFMEIRRFVDMLEKWSVPSLETLEKLNPKLNARFVVQVLKCLQSADTALMFFDWAKGRGEFKHNEFSYAMMITVLGRSRNFEALERLLSEMHNEGLKLNTAVFTALITAYGRFKSMDGAIKIFNQMSSFGCKPDTVTYTTLIHLFAKNGSCEEAVKMFNEMQESGCRPNTFTYSVMVYNYLKAGKDEEAIALFKQMPELGYRPNQITYATLINNLVKSGRLDMAKDFLTEMQTKKIRPLKATQVIVTSALRKAGREDEAASFIKGFKKIQSWDEAYQVKTEKVVTEILFKNSEVTQSA